MERKFKDTEKFLVYEKRENEQIPRLFQIISKEELGWKLESVQKEFVFYLVSEIEFNKKIWIDDLFQQTYIPIIEKDMFILVDGEYKHTDRYRYDGNLMVGYMNYEDNYIEKILKQYNNSNEVYYAIEIGKYNSEQLIRDIEQEESNFVKVEIGEEWSLSKEDINYMTKYDLFCYAKEIGTLEYYDVWSEEVVEMLDERDNALNMNNTRIRYSDEMDYDYEEHIDDMYDESIESMQFEIFKKNFGNTPLLNKKIIPKSGFETYISEIYRIKQNILNENNNLKIAEEDNKKKLKQIDEFIQYKSYDYYYSEIMDRVARNIYQN